MMRRDDLAGRREAVFDALLGDRVADLHPDDHREAAAFWDWLGEQPRPAIAAVAPRRTAPFGWAAAAALLLAVGASAPGWLNDGDTGASVASFAAGRAERRIVRLADGSTVTLGAETRVRVRFTAQQRHLALDGGEALFEVAHDRRRPFVVATRYGAVTAVGTAFDVSIRRHTADVAVVDGTVRVTVALDPAGGAPPIAKLAHKGERVAFGTSRQAGNPVGFISQAKPVATDEAAAWTRGVLVFHGQPLAEVIDTVNRYATSPADELSLTDPRAASVPVFGIVDQGNPAAIRDLLASRDLVAGR